MILAGSLVNLSSYIVSDVFPLHESLGPGCTSITELKLALASGSGVFGSEYSFSFLIGIQINIRWVIFQS